MLSVTRVSQFLQAQRSRCVIGGRDSDFMQVLKAVLNELIVEEYVIFDFMKDYNKEYYNTLETIFKNQERQEVSMPDFVVLSKEAKLFIRTGELKPASNIMLTSATV